MTLLTLARKMAAIALMLWKKGKAFAAERSDTGSSVSEAPPRSPEAEP